MEENRKAPLLSIIIPVYNVEPYLDRCIKSVLGQSYHCLEIILVDDGSTDASGKLCDSYAIRDARVKVVHKENGGIVSARKAGLLQATGEYAACVDSDDWIEPEMYSELMRAMIESQADIVLSGMIRDYGNHYVYNSEMPVGVYSGEELKENVLKKLISTEKFFSRNISGNIWNKLFVRELLLKYQLQVDDCINVGEDFACVYPCLLNSSKVASTGRCYYHYCMRTNSTVGTRRKDEVGRLEILYTDLAEEFSHHTKAVPNIMRQLELLKCYSFLQQAADPVVYYKNGILYPYGKIRREDRVVVYGAGRCGCEVKRVLDRLHCCEVVGWVDKTEKLGALPIDKLEKHYYDKILIAVALSEVAEQIKKELLERDIPESKIMLMDCSLVRFLTKTEV